MMKITLVYPRGMTVYGQEDFKEVYGLLSLAAVLRNGGYRVELADMFFMPLSEGDEFPVELLQAIQGADLIGFSLTGVLQLYWTQRIIGYLRAERNKVFLVAGGVLPTYAPAEALGALTDLDCIIRGEGEESLLALAQALEHRTDWQGIPGVCFKRQDGLIIRPAAPLIADLDRLPFIARDYLRQALGHGNPASVLTSRGCWSKCTFCNSHLLAKLSGGKKRRVRSGENVLRELDYLWERDQVNHIQFADDTLAGPGPAERERLFKIADGMIGSGRNYRFFAEIRTDVIDDRIIRRLVDAGLYDICIGIESWSQSQLDRLGKMTTVAANRRAMEIVIRYPIRNVRIGSLFFDAGVTINELRTQIDNMSQYPQFEVARCKNKVSVYPGALEVRKLQDAGLLYGDWLQYDYRFADQQVAWVFPIVDQLFTQLGKIETEINRLRQAYSQVSPAIESYKARFRAHSFALFHELLDRAAETLGAAEPKREYLSQLALRAGQAVIQSEIEGLALIKIIAETSYENN